MNRYAKQPHRFNIFSNLVYIYIYIAKEPFYKILVFGLSKVLAEMFVFKNLVS